MTESRIQVGMSQDYLETSKLVNDAGEEVHREGVFLGDPLDEDAKVAVANAIPSATDYGFVVRPLFSEDYMTAVAQGRVPGQSVVHKFGKNDGVATALVPICLDGIYRMPQVSGATKLRVKAGNANDGAAGSGAREITLIGLDETGAEVTEAIATAGTSAGPNSVSDFIRLYRSYISASGTYPIDVTTGSQAAAVVIENAAGTEDWLTINDNMGQSHVGAYTVPLGKTAYVNSWFSTVDGNKAHDIVTYFRYNILQTVAPYSAIRSNLHVVGIDEPWSPGIKIPAGPFPALTDLVWSAKVSAGTASVSVDFEILLIDD